MPLMGVDTRRIYVITSALGPGRVGRLPARAAVRRPSFVGLSFADPVLICVLGGSALRGRLPGRLLVAEIISLGGLYLDLEWGYVAFASSSP
jgi:branched-chain amino acid transport system permease protein